MVNFQPGPNGAETTEIVLCPFTSFVGAAGLELASLEFRCETTEHPVIDVWRWKKRQRYTTTRISFCRKANRHHSIILTTSVLDRRPLVEIVVGAVSAGWFRQS